VAKIFFPQYARGRDGVQLRAGETVLVHIRRLGGVEIDSECGGQGVCGRDVIRLEKGATALSAPTEVERRLLENGQLKPGQRLACQARVADIGQEITVYFPNFGKYTILSDYVQAAVRHDPCVVRSGSRVMHLNGKYLGPYDGRMLGLAIDVGPSSCRPGKR